MSAATSLVRPAPPPRTASDADLADEHRRAIRALLRSPLLIAEQADPEDWAAIRRHIKELREWFAEQTGWVLTLDARIGVARLRKQVGWENADPTRGAVVPSAARRPFSRRAYVLFCLACAELDRNAGAQTLVSVLAEEIAIRSATEGLVPFEREQYGERFALVDALRLLESLGILRLTDGDAERFLTETGDALYTIDRDRLGRLVATPRVPSVAAGVEDLVREHYPEGEDGRIRHTRHALVRRLLDDPLVYEFELRPDELVYLRGQRQRLAAWLHEVGLDLERRAEGAAAVDPAGELTDEDFPGTGTLAHATLLFGEFLAARAAEGRWLEEVVRDEELTAFAAVLLQQHGSRWAGSVVARGAQDLADNVVERLVRFRLARHVAGGVSPLPAVGRLRAPQVNALADARAQLALDLGDAPDAR